MADERVPPDRDPTPPGAAQADPDSPTSPWAPATPPASTGIGPAPLSGTWGSLEILEPIGQGGFGHVYRAQDPALGREVALKVVAVPSDEPAKVADILREGRMLARVRHPNVVTVHGAQEYRGSVGIWMELVSGRSLAELVRADGRLGPEEAIVVGGSVLRAVAAVHAAGLVHRDVKAQNVMRETGGRIVLMDFGSGWERGEAGRKREVSPEGTPLYMAPELFAGQPPSVASDVYSVGVLLFFLVTGIHPVEGRTITDLVLSHGLGRRRLLADCRPELPEAFVRVVERALAPTPDGRYQSAGAMARDLADALAGSGAARPEPSAGQPEPVPASADGPGVRPPALAERGDAGEPPTRLAPGRMSPGRWAGAAGAALAFIWMLGFLTSAAFDICLDRPRGFADESVFDQWLWGFRSLVAPAFFALAAVIIVRLVSLAIRALGRVAGLRGSLGLDNPIAAGKTLLVLQIAVVVWVFWYFGDLMAAFSSTVSFSDSAALEPLAPQHFRHREDYRSVLPLLAFGMAAAWVRVWRWRRQFGSRGDRATVIAGVSLVVILAILAEIPYRIFNHNAFQRVAYAGERCYAIGERGTELLLYCPDAKVPRNKVVPAADPRLARTPIVESIFTTRAPAGTAQ
jgi:hypothetical protein